MKQLSIMTLILAMLAASIAPGLAQDEPLQIIASTTIIADVAQQVAGDAAEVQSMMPVGADPHVFEPTPREVAEYTDADLILVNGMNFEEGLLPILANAGTDMNLIEVSRCVEIIVFGGHSHDHKEGDDHDHEEGDMMGTSDPQCDAHVAEIAAVHSHEGDNHKEGDDHDHEEGDDHDHDHEHGAEKLGRLYAIDCGEGHDHDEDEGEEHSHEEGACDPHVWLDPHNVMFWTLFIRDTLSEADPANAETYAANAAAYLAELDELTDMIHNMVDAIPEDERVLVTNHEAFGYFAAAFGFEVVGVVIEGGSTLAEPSAQDLVELIEIVNEEGVPAIYAETTVNVNLAETVASETGVPVLTLYSGSLGDSDSPAATYIDLMSYNAQTITGAFGG